MQLRFAQQMKKGALDMLVLKLLQHEEKYGYQLISELRDRSNGALALKEGTLYPILYRLEDAPRDQPHERARCEGARAQVLRDHEAGRDALREMYEIWNEFDGHVRSIMEEEQ